MAKKKKVIVIIVEGESDRLILDEVVSTFVAANDVVAMVYRGDIFTDNKFRESNISERVRAFFISRLGEYKPSDILCVIHVCDTDGVYIPNECVIVDDEQTLNTTYSKEEILVNSVEQKQAIEERNKQKKEGLDIQQHRSCITYKRIEIPYALYYLSRNLEQVLFQDEAIQDNEKEMRAVQFLDEVEDTDKLRKILEEVFPPIDKTTPDVHMDSWRFIKPDTRSLKRYSNLELLYSFIEQQLADKNHHP